MCYLNKIQSALRITFLFRKTTTGNRSLYALDGDYSSASDLSRPKSEC